MFWGKPTWVSKLAVCALFCVGMALCLTPAMAQSTGTVSGQVTDQTSAVVPGATVTLTDTSTHSSRTAVTNDSGRYVFVGIAPGNYDLSFEAKGFNKGKVTGQRVSVGETANINMALKVGGQNEMVTVEATGAQLQTTNATIGTSMSFDMAQALPGLTRDVSALAMLQPATAPVSGTAGVAGATAGSNADQNMFSLDGGNNSNDMDGVGTVYLTSFAGNPLTGAGSAVPNGVVPTPIDSIEEFKVGVAGQTADFNQAAGNNVGVATRRGGSSWHGTGYDYFYPSTTAANSWANGHTPSTNPATGQARYFTPNPARHYNKFGVSAGGQILPKFLGGKTYLFGFYQGFRFTNSDIIEKPVPSALLRAGVIQVQNSNKTAVTLNGTSYAPGAWMPFNLNPNPVTVNGVTYAPASVCGSGGTQVCDPRGIGLNPIVNSIWSQWMPLGNDPSGGDQHNTLGYSGSIALPQKDNNVVFRLDHDFGSRNKFFASYRYYKTSIPSDCNATNCQVDVGGILGGGTKGQYTLARNIPSVPSILVAGLTSQLSSNMTNDFHWSYTRNWWAWNTLGAAPQPGLGLGGAVEIGGESSNALIPYNVDTQDVRTRFWDGQDHMFRDDVSWLHGNHLITFGGLYQRNWDYHDRNDNGQGIMAFNVYQVANVAGSVDWSTILPPTSVVASSQQSNWESLYSQALGIVGQAQSLYTRTGADLHLLPLGTHAQDKSTINYFQGYASDTWKMKPSFTLTYGLSYALELPPVEAQGKQVMLVDSGDNPIVFSDYMAQKQKAALAGQVYNPIIGFATVPNVGGGRKYPYDTFYGGFGPRTSIAWNPHFNGGWMGKIFGDSNTVIRGGWARIYGRLNGVDLVLVPLLGTGLMQAVQCNGAVMPSAAVNGSQCLGTGGATAATAFRIGTDGLTAPLGGSPSNTLPQPYFPGTPIGNATGALNLAAASGSVLDPKFRPNSNDSFTLSIQREIGSKVLIEVGYIGKLIHNEFQEIASEGVPYMTTLGGQSFAKAYAGLYTQMCGLNTQVCSPVTSGIQPQPFFEAALGGASSTYCSTPVGGVTPANCTQAVALNNSSLVAGNAVYQLWTALASGVANGKVLPGWVLGNTLFSTNPTGGCPKAANVTANTVCAQAASIQWNTSIGYGNYHAGYASFTFHDWKGVTARSNFTWSKALGTGSEVQARSTRTDLDPYNVGASYGLQSFDVKFVYNLALSYSPSFYKSQQGLLGHVLGGWSIAPLFTAQSGFPLRVTQTEGSCTTCQAFGGSVNATAIYNAALINGSFSGGGSLHYLNTSPTGVGTTATSTFNGTSQWLNMFGNPSAAYSQFRRLILGVDTTGGGFGILRGFPRWNLDMTFAKEFKVTERVGMTYTMQFANVLNHFQPSDPAMNLSSPQTFGRINAAEYQSRQVEFGLHMKW